MEIKLVNIGFGNIVSANRIISIVSPESAPIKRIIQEARERGMPIDATDGRRTRAVIVTDSGHIILSAVQPETVAYRAAAKEAGGEALGLMQSSTAEGILFVGCRGRRGRLRKYPSQRRTRKVPEVHYPYGNHPSVPSRGNQWP